MLRKLALVVALMVVVILAGCTSPQWPEPAPPPPRPAQGKWLEGSAGWYGALFHGRMTSSGQEFDMKKMTASHGSLPFGAKVEVVYPVTKKSVTVTINDRNELEHGRVLCLSEAAAKALGAYPLRSFAVRYRWMP